MKYVLKPLFDGYFNEDVLQLVISSFGTQKIGCDDEIFVKVKRIYRREQFSDD